MAGVLPAAIGANAAGRGLICPAACGGKAALPGDVEVLAPASVLALINHFKGVQVQATPKLSLAEAMETALDFADIKGQETAKRALEIAVSSAHNLLMIGPPGGGRSMLAQRLPGTLPPTDSREALDVSMIRSVSGLLDDGKLSRQRPFRDPLYSASLPHWSAAACAPGPARSRSRILAYCSSTNCRNSHARLWRRYASRSNPVAPSSPAPMRMSPTRPDFNSLPQ